MQRRGTGDKATDRPLRLLAIGLPSFRDVICVSFKPAEVPATYRANEWRTSSLCPWSVLRGPNFKIFSVVVCMLIGRNRCEKQ